MFDLMDHFIIFLMDGFHKSLEKDLTRWTENLLEAVKEDNNENIQTSMTYIKKYRDMMNDLSDENREIKDFVGLLVEKYGAGD